MNMHTSCEGCALAPVAKDNPKLACVFCYDRDDNHKNYTPSLAREQGFTVKQIVDYFQAHPIGYASAIADIDDPEDGLAAVVKRNKEGK